MPTVDRKSKSYKLFSARLKAIRPFVDFDFNLNRNPSQSQKRKVKRYFDEISALRNRPNQIYRARKPSNLLKAQQFAQHRHKLPGLKVAFVPTNGKERVKLRFNKTGVIAKSESVTQTKINFSKRALAGDTAAYVQRKIAGTPATGFTIQAGEYEIPIPYLPQSLPTAVAKLVEQYGGANLETLEEDAEAFNHHWANWLFGVTGYVYDDQESFIEYFEEKARNIRIDKKERKRVRDKAYRESVRTRKGK